MKFVFPFWGVPKIPLKYFAVYKSQPEAFLSILSGLTT